MPENFDIRRERIESDKDFERALRPMVMMRSVFHWAAACPHPARKSSRRNAFNVREKGLDIYLLYICRFIRQVPFRGFRGMS